MPDFMHVEGDKPAKLVLYTLSTCGWCKKAKALLKELGVAYDYIDLDLLDEKDSLAAREEMEKWNPKCSFPTIVVDGNRCVIGFQEDKIRSIAGK